MTGARVVLRHATRVSGKLEPAGASVAVDPLRAASLVAQGRADWQAGAPSATVDRRIAASRTAAPIEAGAEAAE